MKAIPWFMMRFPEMGLEMVQNRVQNDLRIDLQDTLPDWSPDDPQILISRPSDILRSRIRVFDVLLTIADNKCVPSKDWIAPPTPCQE